MIKLLHLLGYEVNGLRVKLGNKSDLLVYYQYAIDPTNSDCC